MTKRILRRYPQAVEPPVAEASDQILAEIQIIPRRQLGIVARHCHRQLAARVHVTEQDISQRVAALCPG